MKEIRISYSDYKLALEDQKICDQTQLLKDKLGCAYVGLSLVESNNEVRRYINFYMTVMDNE